MTRKARSIPAQLVHLGTCQSISYELHRGAAKGKIITFSLKGNLLTSDTSARTLYVLPGSKGKEADPSKADKGLSLWSKWSGFTKRSAVAHVLKVTDTAASWEEIGIVKDIFYSSDKWHVTEKVTEYIHTFKAGPALYRLGRNDIYKISPVRITSRGIEDSRKLNPKESRGSRMKDDKAAGQGTGPILPTKAAASGSHVDKAAGKGIGPILPRLENPPRSKASGSKDYRNRIIHDLYQYLDAIAFKFPPETKDDPELLAMLINMEEEISAAVYAVTGRLQKKRIA